MSIFIKVFCEAVGLVIVSEGGFVFAVQQLTPYKYTCLSHVLRKLKICDTINNAWKTISVART